MAAESSANAKGASPDASFTATITAAATDHASGSATFVRGEQGQGGDSNTGASRDWSRLLGSAADALALAGVVFLAGACLLALGTAPGNEHPIPARVRFSCLLGIAIAMPSAVANSISSADIFWLAVTFCLFAISVALLVGHRFTEGFGKFRTLFSGSPIFKVVVLLTVSGALGGLAFHLVTNRSRIEFPNISYLAVSASKPAGAQGVASSGDGAGLFAASGSDLSKVPLLAHNQADAYETMRVSREPFVALITSIFAGVLGDLLIGIIAANAVHLLVSGLINFEHDGSKNDGYLTRQNLTVISLGILAGFAGPKLLPDWASNFFKEKEELRNDLQQNLKQGIKEIKADVKNQPDAGNEQARAKLDETAKKLMSDLVWPYLKFMDIPADQTPARAKFLAESSGSALKADSRIVTVRVAIRLTDEKTTPAPELVAEIDQGLLDPGATSDIQAALHLLAGDCLSFNQNDEEASKRYAKAAELANDPWIKQIANLKLIWVEGPESKVIANFKDLDDLLNKSIPKDLEALFDFTRITLSLAKTIPYPAITGGGSAIEESEKNKAYRAFFAGAVYRPDRWSKTKEVFSSYSSLKIRDQWSDCQNKLSELLDEANTDTYPFKAALDQLSAEKPDFPNKKIIVAGILGSLKQSNNGR